MAEVRNPVSAPYLTSEMQAHFKATNEVKGLFAPIVVRLMMALIPKLVEWLMQRYTVTPRESPE